MKIKHKETGIERSLLFGEWIREYVRKELYKDWEILNLLDVMIVKTLHIGGKVSTTLMSVGEAKKHKNQFSTSTTILKDVVTMEFYQEYLESKILKKNFYSKSSFFKRLLSRIKQVVKPKKNPNEIPFSRAESIQIKIGIWAIIIGSVITIILFVLQNTIYKN
jgi:hypothetical protein